MRFKITGQWDNDFEHDGLLYCAQRIEEMLMLFTSHLYKVPVNNTFLLAYEYMSVCPLVETKKIDQAHLKNIIEEFMDTFSTDIVIRNHFSQDQIDYFVSLLKGSLLSEQKRIIKYIFQMISDYPKWCEETLIEAIKQPNEKRKIEKALRAYIPMLLFRYYDSHYIYNKCQNYFSKKDINSIDCINNFFRNFNDIENDYIVYFTLDKKVGKFKSILESRFDVSFEQDQYVKALYHDSDKYICVHIKVSALDDNGASKRAYQTINLFMLYYNFLGNRTNVWCGDKALVLNSDNQYNVVHFGLDQYFYSMDFDERTLGQHSERIISKIVENIGGHDFYKLHKIINAHNTALACTDVDNAFLNLWSILEIIGVDEYGERKVKLIKY